MELTKIDKIYKSFLELVLDLLFPKKCVSCNRYCSFICLECLAKIQVVVTELCFGCGKISSGSKICQQCRRKIPYLTSVISCVRYDTPPIKDLIHNLKYSGISEIAEILGEFTIPRIRRIKDYQDFVVVPVPSHKKRLSKRGYNQAELIARHISKRLNIPGGAALEKIAETKPQVSLSREMRLKNIFGTIVCADPEFILDKKVFLIDDISTTGATLTECARILKESGAKEVTGVIIAHA